MPNKSTPKRQPSPAKQRKKKALGKGLDALLPKMELPQAQVRDFFQCDIEKVHPNRYQPRRHFDDVELEKLSASIAAQGIIQPLILRKSEIGYELIAGERRLRAAKLAGLKQVPVVVKEISDTELLEMSIVENIQRQDLNPLEEADAYHRLITEFDLTQDKAAERVGKSRSAVTNILRLRNLPDLIKDSIRRGELSMGHARALLGADSDAECRAAWKEVITRKLSVRETERLIKRLKKSTPLAPKTPTDPEGFYYSGLADDLAQQFGTRVQIQRRGQKGRIEIEFYSDDDLDRLIQRFRQV